MAKNDLNKLTASFVAGLRKYAGHALPEDMPNTYPDGGGLFLAYDKGSCRFYWRMKYRIAGKEHRAGYGQFPQVSLAEARACRDRDRRLIAQGIDPVQARKEEEQERKAKLLTYEHVARQWHESTKDNPRNHRATLQRLEKHIFPAIGSRPFAAVRRRELADVLLSVAGQTNARTGAGKVYTAQKLASYLSQIDDYGEARGLIENNRALRLTRALPPLENRGGMPAELELSEISDMLRRMTNFYHGTKGTPYMRAAVRILPYLFFRSAALALGKWQEIDLAKALWTIEAEPMRTKWTEGSKIFPLPRQAVRILRRLPSQRAPGAFIFPSHGKAGHITIEGLEAAHNAAISNGSRKHVPHAWRKVFSTLAREHGAPMVLVETSLAHVTGGHVENTYNKAAYLQARAVLIQWYADFLDALEAGKALPPLPAMEDFSHYDA